MRYIPASGSLTVILKFHDVFVILDLSDRSEMSSSGSTTRATAQFRATDGKVTFSI